MVDVVRVGPGEAATAVADLAQVYRRAPATADVLEEALENRDVVLLLAYLGDECAGFLHAVALDRLDGARMLLVYDVEVLPRYRRRGVGSALLVEALTIADDLGAARTWLLTEPENAVARVFYDSLGGDQFPAVGFQWTRR